MFYEFDAVTPANTTEANAVQTDMKLTAGIIHFVEVMFPAGCAGLVYARVKHGGSPLWPAIATESMKGDKTYIRFNEFYQLKKSINLLRLETWNLSELHAHTITVRVGILKPEELFPEVGLADLIRLFFKQFRRRT